MIITEERRQQLIERAKHLISWMDNGSGSKDEFDIMDVDIARVALASLEANPTYQIQKQRNDIWVDVVSRAEAENNIVHGYRFREVYTAPPVPVMKPIEIHQGVREYLEAGIADCQKSSYGSTGKEIAECMAKLLQPVYHAQDVPVGDHG